MAHNPTQTVMEAARRYAEKLESENRRYTVSVRTTNGDLVINTEPVTDWYASGISFIDGKGNAVFVNTHNALAVEVSPKD